LSAAQHAVVAVLMIAAWCVKSSARYVM